MRNASSRRIQKSFSGFAFKRLVLLLIFFSAAITVLVMRAAWIQLGPNARLESLRDRQFETTVTLESRRGDILDRNGNELAASTAAWSLFADPKIIAEPRAVSRQIAMALSDTSSGSLGGRGGAGSRVSISDRVAMGRGAQGAARTIYEKLKNKKKRFVWVERQLSTRMKDKIQGLKIRGLGFIEEPKRIYPNGSLMANALGFVGKDGRGLEGLEHRLNSTLSTGRQKVAMRKDARGRPLIVNGQVFTEAPAGASVTLTIDRELQFVVESELSRAVHHHEAESATAVVLDAQTSEILALATVPTFDPNDVNRVSQDARRNRAVTDLFEPGSTMKTFVIAGAFEKKLLEPNSTLFAENGKMTIGRRVIREADAKHRFGWITVSDILIQSSNIGSTKVAQMLGDASLREIYSRFGFGEPTGVELPGEARGLLQALPWGEHLLANISFGHGVSASPLQIANAYAAIANGGWLKRPTIVKKIEDAETGTVSENTPKTIRRVLGDDAANKMRLVLTAVTGEDGTGFNARVPGFPVAGKTGTAQRTREGGRGYEPGAYLASFAGFLPANDPRFVIYVSIDRPRKEYYGGAVAAPVFSRIAQFAVRRAGLAPVLISAANVIPAAESMASGESRAKTSLDAKASAAIVRLAEGAAAQSAMESAKGAYDRSARSESLVSSGSSEASQALAHEKNLNLTGLSVREALNQLAEAGVSSQRIRIRGQGAVSKVNWSSDRAITLELEKPSSAVR